MATMLSSLILVCVAFTLSGVNSLPEQGVWIVEMNENHPIQAFSKTMYKGTQISVSITCDSDKEVDIIASWILRRSPCVGEFQDIDSGQMATIYLNPSLPPLAGLPYTEMQYMESEREQLNCQSGHAILQPSNLTEPLVIKQMKPITVASAAVSKTNAPQTPANAPQTPAKAGYKPKALPSQGGQAKERAKRAAEDVMEATVKTTAKPTVTKTEATKPATAKLTEAAKDGAKPKTDTKPKTGTGVAVKPPTDAGAGSDSSVLDKDVVVQVWDDGYYLFVLSIDSGLRKDRIVKVTVRMSLGDSYISAVDRPLLIFYGVMGLVYVFYGVFWLVMLACNWKDLLRVQFWISAVILLGMLEKAAFFGEYENVNNTGRSVHGAVIFAELVSCVTRTLARMLLIIISLGYGIVKPRLGQTFHKVLIVGGIFFILASIEACFRASADKAAQSKPQMIVSVPLAVTEFIIGWWIFTSLRQTIRTLRLRGNDVKLTLYRYFTITLIFCIIASIAFMVWFMKQLRFIDCLTDWKELWMTEAFWHFLFSVILFIIMILWRPTINNQRYAAEDEIDDDTTLSEAYDGMKMRTTKPQQRNGSPSLRDYQKMMNGRSWRLWFHVKWPHNRVLPALGSDEKIMNTKV